MRSTQSDARALLCACILSLMSVIIIMVVFRDTPVKVYGTQEMVIIDHLSYDESSYLAAVSSNVAGQYAVANRSPSVGVEAEYRVTCPSVRQGRLCRYQTLIGRVGLAILVALPHAALVTAKLCPLSLLPCKPLADARRSLMSGTRFCRQEPDTTLDDSCC
jgi:hypothetical protein